MFIQDVQDVQASLDSMGLSDRYDAYDIWLNMDAFKAIGPKGMGGKCGRGWAGLKGSCQRVKAHGSSEAAVKASKASLAGKIRAKKGMKPRSAPSVLTKTKDPRALASEKRKRFQNAPFVPQHLQESRALDADARKTPTVSTGVPADKELMRQMANAPVSIPNSRRSGEPRRKGRSID